MPPPSASLNIYMHMCNEWIFFLKCFDLLSVKGVKSLIIFSITIRILHTSLILLFILLESILVIPVPKSDRNHLTSVHNIYYSQTDTRTIWSLIFWIWLFKYTSILFPLLQRVELWIRTNSSQRGQR